MACVGWCGYCYSGRRGRKAYPGHVGYRSPVVVPFWRLQMPIARSRGVPGSPSAAVEKASCKTLEGFPLIWEYLVEAAFEDGSPRETSTLSVFVEDGVVKVALNDRAELRSAYVTGSDLRAALKALEGQLGGPGPDWRLWGRKTKKK